MISRNNEVVGLRKYLLPTSDILDVKGHYVASDGTNWLVVYYNEKDVTVVGKRIDGSGAILDSTGIEIAFSQTLFDLTFDDRNYLVLTGDINGLCITKVDPRGNVGEATDIPFPPNSVETPVMAYGKKGISLIAYSYCRDSTHQKEIRTMIFNSYTTTIKKAVVSQKLRVNSMRNIKTVEMYDVLGRKVKTVPVSAFANWKEGSGVYIAKFTGTAGRQYKIISFN